MSKILVCGVIDDDSRSTTAHYSYNRLPWIRLTHVCRRFRAVALSTPQFWSYLRLAKSDVFAELLARSKGASLHIKARVDSDSLLQEADHTLALEALLPHSPRIKELHIEGPRMLLQRFCSKTVFPFDALEKLELTCTSSYYTIHAPHSVSHSIPAVVPILASSTAPPRLRHLDLRRVPFCWNDPIFSSPTLTTLVIIGYGSVGGRLIASLPDVGSFDALFSALAAVAPSLEVLELEHTIPTQGVTVADPVQLPIPSRRILLPSIKSIRLTGDAVYIAHLLNHISSPSTASLNITLSRRNHLGNTAFAQSIAAHMSEKPPLLSSRLVETEPNAFTISYRTHLGTLDDSLLQMHSSSVRDHMFPIFLHAKTLFSHVQELRISGTFTSVNRNWAYIFARLPRMTTLVLAQHPGGDMLSALTTLRRLNNGKQYVPAPSLRALHLSDFHFVMPDDESLEPFNDLLDLAIFRCNCDIPLDEIRLIACRYAKKKQLEKLKEVVVDVEYTMVEDDSDEDSHDYDSDYGRWGECYYDEW